jgi:hypothetical protein
MPELTEDQHSNLTSGDVCHLHYHSSDRASQHEQLEQLQNVKVIRYVSANYAISIKDDLIIADTSIAAMTVTLPLSKGGKEFTIIRSTISSNANSLTINFSGGQTMFGQASIVLTAFSDLRTLKSILNGFVRIG